MGAGPDNAWVDPLLTNEWQLFGWSNVAEMTKMGMPGVFTHGEFDTWSPGYLMFLAAMHGSISRLYETFGNGGADTEVGAKLLPGAVFAHRVSPGSTLAARRVVAAQQQQLPADGAPRRARFRGRQPRAAAGELLRQGQRAVQQPRREGPSACRSSRPDDPRRRAQADLLRVLGRQHVEISRISQPFTVPLAPSPGGDAGSSATSPASSAASSAAEPHKSAPPTVRLLPAGSYVVRMDQPHSRIADALLDRQYWSPDDPQTHPYDDTGWSFGELFDVEALRVVDGKILAAAMDPVTRAGASSGGRHRQRARSSWWQTTARTRCCRCATPSAKTAPR